MKVIKFHIDDINRDYRVIGECIDSEGDIKSIYYASGIYESALNEFNYLSIENGFECQKVIIRKV